MLSLLTYVAPSLTCHPSFPLPAALTQQCLKVWGSGERQVFERTVPWGLGSVPALPGTAGTPRRTQSLCSELAGAMPLGTPAASHGQIPALSVPFRFRRRVC